MAVVTKVYTPANIFQGPADVFLDIYPPSSSATPAADANELTLDTSGQPTDTGIAAPAAPTLAQVAGGSLAATTYYAKVTYVNAAGETLPSAEASLAVAANNLLQVASPAAVHGATGWNVYVSIATGTETKQNGSTPLVMGTNWTEPTTALVAGAALPSANTTLLGLHVGSTEAPAQVTITEKFNEIRDDQHESAIDLAFDTVEAEIDFHMKESDLGKLQKTLTSNALAARNLLATQDVLQVGGQADSSMTQRTLLLVAPRRDVAGKFVYVMAYNAFLKSAVQLTFQRSKENVFKLKFGCLMDSTRVAGDEVMQIVRTK